MDFWDRVETCGHMNLSPNYSASFNCQTPYCSGYEDHCLDCGAYIQKCGCGFNVGMSGWPRRRHMAQERKKRV